MAVQLVVFDLDGVLFDPADLVVAAVRRAAAETAARLGCELPEVPADRIHGLMGRPSTGWADGLGLPMTGPAMADFKRALERELVAGIRTGQGRLHPGLTDVLEWLAARGVSTTIASNCSRPYLTAVLDQYDLDRRLDMSVCHADAPLGDKADLLRLLLENRQVLGGETVYIGDRGFDAEAAAAAGTAFIGCLWGFGRAADFPPGTTLCPDPVALRQELGRRLAPTH